MLEKFQQYQKSKGSDYKAGCELKTSEHLRQQQQLQCDQSKSYLVTKTVVYDSVLEVILSSYPGIPHMWRLGEEQTEHQVAPTVQVNLIYLYVFNFSFPQFSS